MEALVPALVPVHTRCLQNSIPCCFRAQGLISSLAVMVGPLLASFLHLPSQQQNIKFPSMIPVFPASPSTTWLLNPSPLRLTAAAARSVFSRADANRLDPFYNAG